MEEELFLSEREAAKKAGVGRATLQRHRAAGNIRPLVLKYVVLYTADDLAAWKEQYILGRGGKQQ